MLEKAIESIIAQTHPYFEIVVLDNASSDETKIFMEDLVAKDNRVKYHRNSINLGMTENFNLIGPLVSQPFFCCLTDDDVYEPHFFQTALDLFHKYPDANFVGTNAPILKDGKITKVMIEDWQEGFHPKGSRVLDCSQSRHPLFTHCIFRQALATDFVFYDSIRMIADGFLLTCLATKYDMAVSKIITGYWNIHGQNATENQLSDNDAYITALTSRITLYKAFCVNNGLSNRLSRFYKEKLLIGLLQTGNDPLYFQKMMSRADVREIFSPVSIFAIRLMHAINLLGLSLSLKRLLRRYGVIQ